VGTLVGIVIGSITFRLKGHYFSLAMLAYPPALMPVFSWAGWNEVSLPLERHAPAACMQFTDPRVMPLIALALLIVSIWLCLRIERARLGLVLYAIRQNERRPRPPALPPCDASSWRLRSPEPSPVWPEASTPCCCSSLPGIRLRHAGLGPSADRQHVWRIGCRLGSRHRRRYLGAACRDAQRHHWGEAARHPSTVFGLAIMVIILYRPQGVYWAFHDLLPSTGLAVAAPAPTNPEALSFERPSRERKLNYSFKPVGLR
jgi:hypothetical protein